MSPVAVGAIAHRRRACCCLLLGTMLLTSAISRANGRYPLAQQLFEDPEDPTRLWIRATFGILSNTNANPRWAWICENSVGYGGSEDPSLGVMSGGTVIAGLGVGMAVSHSYGCDWSFVEGPLDGNFIVDVSVAKADPTQAVALLSSGLVGGQFLNQVHETTDNARSWHQLGEDLPAELFTLTLDPAPSDPDRIYISGIQGTEEAVLLTTDDRGQTWSQQPITNTSSLEPPYIAAVHPADPDSIFVRVNGTTEDVLLHSPDAGTSWNEILRGRAKLFGFALSPDGSTVLAGFGDRPEVSIASEEVLGIWKASIEDFAFEKIFDGPVYCLTWTEQGLYACTSRILLGFDLGFAEDVSFTLQDSDPFTPRMELPAVCDTERDCPNGTLAADVCSGFWPETCFWIGSCGQDGQPAPQAAKACGLPAPTNLDGGSAPSPEPQPPADPAPGSSAGSRSGCMVVRVNSQFGVRWIGLPLLLLAGLRWRRQRYAQND